MNTLKLKWKELVLGSTQYYSSHQKPNNFALQWHAADSTLFIHVDELIVDVRLEREVGHIAFQDPYSAQENAFIFITMLLARPFDWSALTDFDPRLPDLNKIAIYTKVTNHDDLSAYEALTKWMIQNVYPGEAETLTVGEANVQWEKLSRLINIDDGEDDPDTKSPILRMGGAVLYEDDLRYLQPGMYANDGVIYFALQCMEDRMKKSNPETRFLVLSTFWSEVLFKRGPEASASWRRGKKEKQDFFEHDMVIIPFHKNHHWWLVVVDHPGYIFDSDKDGRCDNERKIGIYILDSLRSAHPSDLFSKMEEYIVEEAKLAVQAGYPMLRFSLDSEKFTKVEVSVPMQPNFHDCGFYMLHFAQMIMENTDKYREIMQSGTGSKLSRSSRQLRRIWGGDPGLSRGNLRKFIETKLSSP